MIHHWAGVVVGCLAVLAGATQGLADCGDPSSSAPAAQAPGVRLVAAQDKGFTVDHQPQRLVIQRAGQPLAEFVFRDDKILRPYFANLHAPGGTRVTRNHPPVEGVDATDHDTMHPGLWLGFGDINGHDFWRNQGRIEHVRFSSGPRIDTNQLAFTTESKLVTADAVVLCELECRFAVVAYPTGTLIGWSATFQGHDEPLVFGDQEEMGFGARVATPLVETQGGRIVNSERQQTAQETWGQPAAWCDYAGQIEGRQAGITLMAAGTNFRESWWHNRDYGVFVANPFGREAMKQGPKSSITVEPGKPFRLQFAAFLHDAPNHDPAQSYRHFQELSNSAAGF